MEHMLLMCEIPWHYTGNTKMKMNNKVPTPPEAQSLIKHRCVNKIIAI